MKAKRDKLFALPKKESEKPAASELPTQLLKEDLHEYMRMLERITRIELEKQNTQLRIAILEGQSAAAQQERSAAWAKLVSTYHLTDNDSIDPNTGEITRKGAE